MMQKTVLFFLLLLFITSAVAAIPVSDAAHLLRRTGFDVRPENVQKLASLNRRDAVESIVNNAQIGLQVLPPAWALDNKLVPKYPITAPKAIKKMANREMVDQQREWLYELQDWLVEQVLVSDNPLAERMTLFWQNHFVSAWKKVRNSQLMFDQYMTLRRNALGSFADMLYAMVRDPAMLIYLDNGLNRKGSPNENLAREILELFSLGEGHYSERDIKEAARALSGWTVNRKAEFAINRRHHDEGVKSILGATGRFDAEDLVDIILNQEVTAKYIVSKLWQEFVSPEPDMGQVDRLANIFRDSGYQIRPLLRAMFSLPAFWAEENRGSLIKSPMQLVIGTARLLELPVTEPRQLVRAVNSMGQNLFQPPNVKGWPGGTNWINSNSLLARTVFINRVTRGQEMSASKKSLSLVQFAPGISVENLKAILLCCQPATDVFNSGRREVRIRSLLSDPVYQLY